MLKAWGVEKGTGGGCQGGRIWGLDALKAIAICMVIPLHTGLFHTDYIQYPTIYNLFNMHSDLLARVSPSFSLLMGIFF